MKAIALLAMLLLGTAGCGTQPKHREPQAQIPDTVATQDSMPIVVPRTEDSMRVIKPDVNSRMPVVKPDSIEGI